MVATVGGRNPANQLRERWFISIIYKVHTFQLVQDFFHQQYVYLQSYHTKSSIHVGKYTSQMDPMGLNTIFKVAKWEFLKRSMVCKFVSDQNSWSINIKMGVSMNPLLAKSSGSFKLENRTFLIPSRFMILIFLFKSSP